MRPVLHPRIGSVELTAMAIEIGWKAKCGRLELELATSGKQGFASPAKSIVVRRRYCDDGSHHKILRVLTLVIFEIDSQ